MKRLKVVIFLIVCFLLAYSAVVLDKKQSDALVGLATVVVLAWGLVWLFRRLGVFEITVEKDKKVIIPEVLDAEPKTAEHVREKGVEVLDRDLIDPHKEDLIRYSERHNTDLVPIFVFLEKENVKIFCKVFVEKGKEPVIVEAAGNPCRIGWKNHPGKLANFLAEKARS